MIGLAAWIDQQRREIDTDDVAVDRQLRYQLDSKAPDADRLTEEYYSEFHALTAAGHYWIRHPILGDVRAHPESLELRRRWREKLGMETL